MLSLMDFSSQNILETRDNAIEMGSSDKDPPQTFEPPSSTCRTDLQTESFIQPPLPQPNSSLFESLVTFDVSKAEQNSQAPLPTLNLTEEWDLEGYFQLAYLLATVSLSAPSSELTLWDTYSPCLIEVFYRMFDGIDCFVVDDGLAASFQGCAEVFATFNEWPEQTKASVFDHYVTGREALRAILQLVKLAKGFGIEGASWWELRRNLWMAFVEPLQRQRCISAESDIFQRIFRQGLQIFYEVGFSQESWKYAIIAGLSEWRKAKEAQEIVAADRTLLALKRRNAIADAWETLKETVNGGTQNLLLDSLLNTSHLDHIFVNDFAAQMSPGSRLREHERRKPLLNLQQRLAPSPTLTSPQYLRQTPFSGQLEILAPITPNYNPISQPISDIYVHPAFRHSFPTNQFYIPLTPATPEIPSSVSDPQKTYSSEGGFQLGLRGLADTGLLNFGEFMDIDPLNWPGGSEYPRASSSNNDQLDKVKLDSPSARKGIHLMGSKEVIDKTLDEGGKELWEMTDEEFRKFCGIF